MPLGRVMDDMRAIEEFYNEIIGIFSMFKIIKQ
jgi:hypothetical protein